MTEPAFEMLWDCSSCGTTGLLGKSQRRCPNCGAPQDPTRRYFPKPGEAVEVKGHSFVGADWSCAACSTPCGAAASFCVNCGNPKDGNVAVATKADRIVKDGAVVAPSPSPSSAAPRSTPAWLKAALAAFVAVVVVVLALFLWKKDATVDVTAHRWTREIDVERFDAVRDDAWCDALPAGAYNVSRHRAVRTTRRIPDGQDCHDRNVDKGDGTFVVKKECTTKYREEPVYDDRCAFDVDRWRVVRTAQASGALVPLPAWPVLRLASTAGRGAERAGARRESYVLVLRDARSGKTHECAYAEDRWRGVADASRHTIKVRGLGGAVCDTLR
ncbi:MAG: zinc ribbon domain-containing protein [Deltaproteobacteria bacterium]|nr:zinc ribbon domain-containing protein [Deltaproteobacteria bacterium]